LSFVDAAALPLTTLTAWESLFERFAMDEESRGDLVVLGAAGGVGSVMIQLAKALTEVRVIATASRDDSRQWATQMGADVVINHHQLRTDAPDVAPAGIDYVFSPHSKGNVETFAEIMRPLGHVVAIDEPGGMDLLPLKQKSIAWHWELMFTRAMFGYDMIAQQRMLTKAAALVDDGVLRSTLTESIGDFSAAGIREAHRRVESGHMVGKVVVYRS
jgi:zinc-binding alcohol dehydrogenase family protein